MERKLELAMKDNVGLTATLGWRCDIGCGVEGLYRL